MKKLLLALAMTCSVGHAEIWSGNVLLANMNGNVNDQLAATGYIVGAIDGLGAKGICMQDKVTVGQVSEVTKSLLVGQPENRHQAAALFVWGAIIRNFSCDPAPAKKPTKST